MTADLDTLLANLTALDVRIEARGDKLHIDAPAGAVTPDLRQALAEHKQALLARLGEAGTGAGLPTFPQSWQPYYHRIPLDDLSGYLARHRLHVVGGTAFPDGRTFRPTLYLADDPG